MSDAVFVHIRAPKFQILPGEDDVLFNPGTYGMALCQYLEAALRGRGHDVPSYNPEDWGWWFEVAHEPVRLALQIYGREQSDGSLEHAVLFNETGGRTRALRPSKRIDRTPFVEALRRDLLDVFETDPDIEIVQITDDFPLD
ncbi:MAG: hypothetical protein AAGE98_18770 [Actinomycetota bacterium]